MISKLGPVTESEFLQTWHIGLVLDILEIQVLGESNLIQGALVVAFWNSCFWTFWLISEIDKKKINLTDPLLFER